MGNWFGRKGASRTSGDASAVRFCVIARVVRSNTTPGLRYFSGSEGQTVRFGSGGRALGTTRREILYPATHRRVCSLELGEVLVACAREYFLPHHRQPPLILSRPRFRRRISTNKSIRLTWGPYLPNSGQPAAFLVPPADPAASRRARPRAG